MEEANKRAVAEILTPQNLRYSDSIDLHGLLVNEAVQATKDFVKSKIGTSTKTVEVITGRGLHSDPSKGAVIKPAIVTLCKEQGWKMDTNTKNQGSFLVIIPSKKY